jgi:hypothetical protein
MTGEETGGIKRCDFVSFLVRLAMQVRVIGLESQAREPIESWTVFATHQKVRILEVIDLLKKAKVSLPELCSFSSLGSVRVGLMARCHALEQLVMWTSEEYACPISQPDQVLLAGFLESLSQALQNCITPTHIMMR